MHIRAALPLSLKSLESNDKKSVWLLKEGFAKKKTVFRVAHCFHKIFLDPAFLDLACLGERKEKFEVNLRLACLSSISLASLLFLLYALPFCKFMPKTLDERLSKLIRNVVLQQFLSFGGSESEF